MAKSKLLDLGDVSLHYVEAPGPGPVLLLLEAFSDSLESYVPLLPTLSTLFHVYAVDFRGHGKSSHTPHHYSFRTHVDDIKRFIDTIIRAPLFVAGHSMGGHVATWLASLYPDTVRALIVEDTGFDFPPDEKVPGFAVQRDRLAKFKSSGTSIEEATTIVGTESTPENNTTTRFEVYGSEIVQQMVRRWLELDLTHYDSYIEGRMTKGWDGKEILSNITCNLRLSSRHIYGLKISTKTCTFPSSSHQLAVVIALLSRPGGYGAASQSFPIAPA